MGLFIYFLRFRRTDPQFHVFKASFIDHRVACANGNNLPSNIPNNLDFSHAAVYEAKKDQITHFCKATNMAVRLFLSWHAKNLPSNLGLLLSVASWDISNWTNSNASQMKGGAEFRSKSFLRYEMHFLKLCTVKRKYSGFASCNFCFAKFFSFLRWWTHVWPQKYVQTLY